MPSSLRPTTGSGRLAAPLATLAGLLVLTGCQPDVRLMPSPLAFTKGEGPADPVLREARNSPDIPIFYATNRQRERGGGDAIYSTFPDEDTHFGIAHVRIGDGSLRPEDVEQFTASTARWRRPPLRLVRMEELASLGPGPDPDAEAPVRAFFEGIDAALARTRDRNLIVYVHGANTPVRRATGHAAQFHHFTARESVMLVFVWPSRERLRTYLEDMRQARASGPVFARLLETLAARTRARHIDVLAYSAGAEVASVGLAALGAPREGETRAAQKERLRLGHIYFAAPDTGAREFATNLGRYVDLTDKVSLSANLDDTALALAEIRHGAARAGRPNLDEFSPEETLFLAEASQRLRFDLISVDPDAIPDLSQGSHGFWYTNARVSNDVMAAFVRRYRPEERELEARATGRGLRYWIFPSDYEERIAARLRAVPLHGSREATETQATEVVAPER